MILVAPDSFKGTFTATEVADAIARGIEDAGGQADRCPIADGGEGTAAILLAARGGRAIEAEARDPLGRAIHAGFAVLDDGIGVVDVAAASGLGLAPPDVLRATTHGTGDLVRAAVAAGAREVWVAAGGSATVDGGAGAIEAIGDPGVPLVVLCDVRTPFERCAALFGPQKGARPEDVAKLDERLRALAGGWPRDPRGRPLTGAAGGLSGGLWAALGAELRPGAAAVLDAVGFDRRLARAAAVVVGEGRVDAQTPEGKAVAEVVRRAHAAGVPVHAVAGRIEADLGFAGTHEASTTTEMRAAGTFITKL